MREIEVKAWIRDREAIMNALTTIGCTFGDPVIQNDVIFQKKNRVEDSPVARVRLTNDGTILFTVKKRGVNELASQEHEVTVSSAKELEKMLILLDQEEVVRINKKRISAHHDSYEICIDDVEDLGSFIEIEAMISDDDVAKAQETQNTLFEFLLSLGISPEDRVTVGYNSLLLEKKERGE